MVTLAALVASASAASSSANRKPVTSLLTAKWASTPFHLEMSEFVADEDNGAFWEMVDFFVEERDSIGRSLSDRDERIQKSSFPDFGNVSCGNFPQIRLNYLNMLSSLTMTHSTFYREFYDKCVSFASRFLTASQTALMKLSLSLRTHSPRIEMFQQGRYPVLLCY